MSAKHWRTLLFSIVITTPLLSIAQTRFPTLAPQTRVAAARSPVQPAPPTQLRKASELIRKQEPLKIDQGLLKQTSAEHVHIVVSLPKQRAYLMLSEQIVIDSPISSGKRGHTSPSGHFTVLEKDPNHHSTLYGDFVDHSGRTVRAGVSARIDAAPSGTHFTGAPMRWFMRLTGEGVGMHVGILPGYPASHGCIRMPTDGAKLFYDHVKVGTTVDVGDY
jgi:lipoprotein-anchoring transpeptidase ErfK/SrfK